MQNTDNNKLELVVQALQQRIGEIVSNYETQLAVYRAEITQLVNAANEKPNVEDTQKESK